MPEVTPLDFGITDHLHHFPEGTFSDVCDPCWLRMQSCGLCGRRLYDRSTGETVGVRFGHGVRVLNQDGSHSVRHFVCADHAAFVRGLGYAA